MNPIKFLLSLLVFSISNLALAELNYRCEHQGSQNAMQFPIENYFYVTIKKPKTFTDYTITFVKNKNITKVLKYQNGFTAEIDVDSQKIIKTDWNNFNKAFAAYVNELKPLMSSKDNDLKFIPQLNIDFLSKINEANIFHSATFTNEVFADRKSNEAIFNLTGSLLDIEKTTSLPGNKVNYQIANKNITYNDATGMLLQVEVKINSAFLRYVFACKTWNEVKNEKAVNVASFKNEDGAFNQYALYETDYEGHSGYFSKAIMDVMFKVSANAIKENPEIGLSVEAKTKIIHALIKSKVWDSYIKRELFFKDKQSIQDRIKYLILVYSQKYLTREYGGLDSKVLAQIYQDMFVIIGSYHELLMKGYK